MYGAVHNSSSNKNATSIVAFFGCAAVFAVAGFVAAQPGALYAPASVRPAVASMTAAPAMMIQRPSSAVYATNVQAQNVQGSGYHQVGATFAPIVLGVGAITAFVAALLHRGQKPVAMAATTGERLLWIPNATPPAHLTGEFPGDRGFDPLGLAKDPKVYQRMRISEVFHGRLAMLGIVGCVAPELFFSKGAWFDYSDYDLNRLGLIALQVIAPLEYWRGNGGFSWDGNDGPDRSYPGFDPLGLTNEETKLQEIKNGRLAMTAMLGLEVQSHITGKSPLTNLSEHLSHPLSANLLTGGGSLAMFSTAGQKTDRRPLWFPGGYAPSWLTGQHFGDRGFDPAGLAADPKVFERMRVSEVYHGRLAMLAIVGAVVPDIQGKGAWYEAAQSAGIGVNEVAVFTAAYGIAEVARGLKANSDPTSRYPGFDPLNLTTDYTKEAEIKNGRLALTAMLGLEVQRHVTGVSPLVNLVEHVKHPLGHNIAESVMHQWPVAMFAATGHKDGVWFPGATPPAHLTGEYPADRGFDPLSLAADPTVYARMRVSEVFHARLCMLAIVGAIVPEVLGKGAWFEAGNSVDGIKLGFIAMAIAAPTEYWRGNGGFNWDKGAADRSYPGFDPLKLTTDYTKAAEIKNGRLAMAGLLGLTFQYLATGESPLANLAAHLANPVGANITTTLAMYSTSGEKYRGLWFPNITPPAYLTGEFPADRGFDPAGLAADPKVYERMRIAEVFNGRLAMLAIVGCVYPELLGNGVWFEVWNKVDFYRFALISLQVVAPLEYWRGNGGFGWDGEEKYDRSYPGFDPCNLTTEYTKAAEIKNGRLAMIGMFGLEVQSHVTAQGPVANLIEHLRHPLAANIGANLAHPWPPVAMFATTGHKDGVWFPGATPPAHLTGEYPADRGFDPLSLAADPTVYARMRVSEVFHARLCMLAIVGAIVPEVLGKGAWFEAGNSVDGIKLGFIAMAIAAPTEYWRGNGGFNWDKGAADRSYPGFDPLKLTTDYTKAAEIKNGRLAMAGLLGLTFQYLATGESPLANLAAHLANPVGANITTTLAMYSTSGEKYRGLWFPNITPPAYLTGEFPADRGFDPAGLAADPKVYERMRIAEVFNGRLAMLAIVGCVYPELLGNGVWFEVWNKVDFYRFALISLQVVAPLEYWRGNGGFGWDSEEKYDRSYPGFDPCNLTTEYTKAAEIKNGRLAMIGMFGLEVQSHVTAQGPVANLIEHLRHPLAANIGANLAHPWPPVAMFATTGHKDGVWFPGATPPAHLTGEYPADRGFDPLSLAADPTVYARMRVSEVFHARLCMLAIVGAIVPEVLGKGAWFEAGNSVDGIKLGFIAMAIAAPTEYWRGNGGFNWDKGAADRSYPGFDPLKLTTDYTKAAEIKNGRLAMAGLLGLTFQYLATGESPLANLAAHLANPVGANITTTLA